MNYFHVKIETILSDWEKKDVPVTQDGPKPYPCCKVRLKNLSDDRSEDKFICVWDDRIAGLIQKDVEYVGAYKPVQSKVDGSKIFILYIGLKQNECLADPTKPKYVPHEGGHSGGYSKSSPEKETSIRRQCCLKGAVELAKMGMIPLEKIEEYLNSFEQMIVSSGVVSSGQATTGEKPQTGFDSAPPEPAPLEQVDEQLPF